MPKAQMSGLISRISIDTAENTITLLMQEDRTIYVFGYPSNLPPKRVAAITLAKAGDHIGFSYWAHTASRAAEHNGEISKWENSTMGITADIPSDIL
jgi:hypothetical protein